MCINQTVGLPVLCKPFQNSSSHLAHSTQRINFAPTLVLVDPGVADYAQLIAGVAAGSVVQVLAATGDPIRQITEVLATYHGISRLHLVSHGEAGCLHFAGGRLTWDNLSRYRAAIASWSQALTDNSEILLYGCNVASNQQGKAFVRQLAGLTGASIAASTSLTGNASLGGNWNLEFVTAALQTVLAFRPETLLAYGHVLAGELILSETFRGADVTNPNWLFGNAGGAAQNPFLTARPFVSASSGGLPGNPGTPDADGSGALRLTNNTTSQASFVIYNQPLSANNGLSITFDLFSYGGTVPGADGISFFLIDGSTNPSTAGAPGGSLGYSGDGSTPGIVGGFLGIGFDEFGNFSNSTYGAGGIAGTSPQTVAIRGRQSTNYNLLTRTAVPGGTPIDNPGAGATRANSKRTVAIDITPTGLVTVRMDLNNNNIVDPGETLINNFDTVAAGNGSLPSTFKFGFSASTGASTNFHEITNYTTSTFSGTYTRLVNFATTTARVPESTRFDVVAQVDLPTTSDITIPIQITGGSAAAGTDFTIGTTITIPANQRTGSIPLDALNRIGLQGDRPLIITMQTPTSGNASLSTQNIVFNGLIVDRCPAIDIHDFNGDGASDILWRDPVSGQVSIWLMNGTQTIGGGFTANPGFTWEVGSTGDFNGDGRSDILWRDTATGENVIWLMNGEQIQGGGAIISTGATWRVAGSADFNGDGRSDILWRNTASGENSIWQMNGIQVQGGGFLLSTALNWQVGGLGDFDGDCRADILWRSPSTGSNVIWLMNGSQIQGGGETLPVFGENWRIEATGDLDADGKFDIVWRNTASTEVAVWQMNSTTTVGGGTIVPAGAGLNWQLGESGDYDRDGRFDLLWRDKGNQRTTIWLMSSRVIKATSGDVNPVAGPNWEIDL